LKYFNSKLYIAGDGEELENLIKLVDKLLINDKVEFLGHIPQNELFEYMKNVHFFLLMSRYHAERLPNVIKEAMLRKCICITTPTIGINHNNDGYIFDDNESAYNILINLQKSQDRIEKLSNNTQQKIINNFNVKKTMLRYGNK